MKSKIVSMSNIKVKEKNCSPDKPVMYCLRNSGKIGTISIATIGELEQQIRNDVKTIENYINVATEEKERIILQTAKKNILESELIILGSTKEIERLTKKAKSKGKLEDYYGI